MEDNTDNPKMERISSHELDLYKVRDNLSPSGERGWAIVLHYDSRDPDIVEHIFGVPGSTPGAKEFLDYWCLRLNRGFVQGWAFAKGYTICQASPEYYKIANKAYEAWITLAKKR